MDTIKIIDFSECVFRQKLGAGEISLYVSPKKGGGLSYGMTINQAVSKEATGQGFTNLYMAENTLTGEKFIVLNEDTGVPLREPDTTAASLTLNRKSVIKQIMGILGLDPSIEAKYIINISGNKSTTEGCATYKVEGINKH